MSEGTSVDPEEMREDPAPGPRGNLREPKGKSAGQGIGEWIGILIAALLAAFLIKTYVMQTFWIPSASMERTLLINDRVLVNKLAYHLGDVHRGDVVVFERPPGETDQTIKDLIKRVIGLPGETIEARNGVVFVNGNAISEPYLQPGTPTVDLSPTKVPADHYFVMGDNRTNSADSRRFGAIDKSLLVGKASLRIWPASRIGTIP